MSDFGVTLEGFKRKRFDQLLAEINTEFKSVFGENLNLNPESPDGQINGSVSESNANLWELAELCYNAFNPSASSGVALSNLVQLNGISRLPAVSSVAQLTITGSPNTTIPEGSLVSTNDTGDQFATDSEITLDGAGNGSVQATAIETGSVSAVAGSLTEIDTPVTGWDTVTNIADADEGNDEETDVELRSRRRKSVSIAAQSVIDSIYAAVANIPGVDSVSVLENDTDITDINGQPGHSFQVIVSGGDDTEIGQTIWVKKPAGILSYGVDTTVIITDSQGLEHDISFSRPTEVDIYVEVDITKFSDYPTNGDELMKQAIVDYANGELIPERGFALGEDVIYSRLYTPINLITGHQIENLLIDIVSPPTGTSNVTIGITEISNFTTDNITIV